MNTLSRAASVLGVLSVLASTGCGAGGAADTPQAGDGARPCTSLPAPDPAAALPTGFPALPGQVLYDPGSQGSTTVVFGRVEGTDLFALRDELADRIGAADFRIDGTDQEAVEAEAHFTATTRGLVREGSVRVTSLCAGVLSVRYRLSG